MSSLRTTMLHTVDEWAKAHNTYDMATVATLRTPTCRYPRLPKSLNAPPLNNEEWDAFFPTTKNAFAKRDVNINDTIVDEEKRKVVLMAHETGESPNGVKYDNQIVIVITLNQEGTLVEEHLTFMDSAHLMEFMKAVGAGGAPEGT